MPPPPFQRKPLGNARKVQCFVAAHVVAVTLIYGVALWVGGGVAEAPMPPEALRSTAPLMAATASTVAVADAVVNTAGPLPAPPTTTLALDAPAPWDIDRHGTVHWRQP